MRLTVGDLLEVAALALFVIAALHVGVWLAEIVGGAALLWLAMGYDGHAIGSATNLIRDRWARRRAKQAAKAMVQ